MHIWRDTAGRTGLKADAPMFRSIFSGISYEGGWRKTADLIDLAISYNSSEQSTTQ